MHAVKSMLFTMTNGKKEALSNMAKGLWSRYACCFSRSVVSESFLSPWTVAHQAPRPWNFPGKITGVGCHFLLQGTFPTQGSNLCLLLWQVDSLPLS